MTNKKKFFLIIFMIFFIINFLFLIFFLNKKNNNNFNNNLKTKKTTEQKFCVINTFYFKSSFNIKQLELSYSNIKFKKINNTDDTIVKCNFNKLKNAFLANLEDWVEYSIQESQKKLLISFKKVNSNYIINNIKCQKINNKPVYFKYFVNKAYIIKFLQNLEILKKYWKIENYKIEYSKNILDRIKFKPIMQKYWNDIIVTNIKCWWLLPTELNKIKLKINNKEEIQKLKDIINNFSKSIVYKQNYIILHDLNKIINE